MHAADGRNGGDPLALLADDRATARKSGDPWANLCVFATTDDLRDPQMRVVVLRELDDKFAVFINGTSPKHREVGLSRHQAVLVYLASLGVQYRLRVTLDPVPQSIVHASWSERPRIPKVMDWLYERMQPQSTAIASSDALITHYAELDRSLPHNVTAPQQAVGYYLVPAEVERLELAGDRPHTRVLYQQIDGGWHVTALVP